MLFIWASSLFAEQRFPPPEFEGGYKLPATAVPASRQLLFQYLDMAVLIAALGIATWLAYKKRSRRGMIALSIGSLLYFGFWRKGCVCAIGSVQNVSLALADSHYALPIGVTTFFLVPLLFAMFAGRTFCSAVCPHGALQDLVLLKPVKVPGWLEQGLGLLPYVYLGAGILFAATGSCFLFCQYDPFVPIFRMQGRTLMVMTGIGLLLAGIFVGRPYCRFLCPYGALLRMASWASKWRVRVTPNYCTQCRLCENSCPYGALREPQTVPTEKKLVLTERKRLGRLLLLFPVLLAAGGWVGWKFSGPAATLNPTIALAREYALRQNQPPKQGPLTAADFAFERASQNPEQLSSDAAQIQKHFTLATTLLGVWIGLVIGVRVVSVSLRRLRTDYEPDRSACLVCARCFDYCPNERVRRGLPALETLAAPEPKPLPGS